MVDELEEEMSWEELSAMASVIDSKSFYELFGELVDEKVPATKLYAGKRDLFYLETYYAIVGLCYDNGSAKRKTIDVMKDAVVSDDAVFITTIKEMVETARQYIRNNRPQSQLYREQEFEQAEVVCLETVLDGHIFACYRIDENKLYFSRQLLTLPKEYQIKVIIHELCHALLGGHHITLFHEGLTELLAMEIYHCEYTSYSILPMILSAMKGRVGFEKLLKINKEGRLEDLFDQETKYPGAGNMMNCAFRRVSRGPEEANLLDDPAYLAILDGLLHFYTGANIKMPTIAWDEIYESLRETDLQAYEYFSAVKKGAHEMINQA